MYHLLQLKCGYIYITTAFWISFFVEAGIPSAACADYAIIFTENRIQKHMLLDLNKEYLKDMGVNVLGDIIAILKHSKRFHEKVPFGTFFHLNSHLVL